MLADILTIFTLGLLLLFLWLARGNWRLGSAGDLSGFRDIDLQALRNLVSPEEDIFLLANLSHENYVKIRRARVRAIQQYLGWIAENCAVLLRLISQTTAQSQESSPERVHGLVRSAVQLRLLCLGLWALLWLEYALPVSGISPRKLIRSYERMKEAGAPYIAGKTRPQPTAFASDTRM